MQASWLATNWRGQRVAAGAYFVRLRVGEEDVVRRMIVGR